MSFFDFDSGSYWERRYDKGQNSGAGSYDRLAKYKAEFLNRFVEENQIGTIVELGCGDGSQLDLCRYPLYLGIDVSRTAIEICSRAFSDDLTKCFLTNDLIYGIPAQELSLSLDVIFHLTEDYIFEKYMSDLFSLSWRFVIIYSSDRDEFTPSPHVRHRAFTQWVSANRPDWRLIKREVNPFPEDGGDPLNTSFADFYIYQRLPNVTHAFK